MGKLPKTIIKQYGITKKAWRVYRRGKSKVTRRRRGRPKRRSVRRRVYKTVRRVGRRVKNPITKIVGMAKKYAHLAGVALGLKPTIETIMANPQEAINMGQRFIQNVTANPMGTVQKVFNPVTIQTGVTAGVLGVVSKIMPTNVGITSVNKILKVAKDITTIGAKAGGGYAVGTAFNEVLK